MSSLPGVGLHPAEAIGLQRELCRQVILTDQFGPVKRVAGVDVGFEARGAVSRAAVVVLNYPELNRLDSAIARRPTQFPYIPGLLSFRELPVILDAMEQLRVSPDLVFCDGQGIAHPRRFGIASHLGVVVNIPSIGVAKTRLLGIHDPSPEKRGGWSPLLAGLKGEIIGAVLRTRSGVKPLYVSTGHRISLESAVAYVMGCCTRYRLPETTRLAHRLASGLEISARE